jgi:hypothetical protein
MYVQLQYSWNTFIPLDKTGLSGSRGGDTSTGKVYRIDKEWQHSPSSSSNAWQMA